MGKKKTSADAKSPERLSAIVHTILRNHAPALASGLGRPEWTPAIADRVRSDIQKRGLGDAGISLVNTLLHHAEIRGLGTFERIAPSRQSRISASRLRGIKAEDLMRAQTLLDALNEKLQAISECSDPHVIAGATLISGALHSGILIPVHLEQLLVRTKVKEAAMGLEFIALDLTRKSSKRKVPETADPDEAIHDPSPLSEGKHRADHQRRQALQSPTAFLARRYTKAIDRLPWPKPGMALEAATAFLGLPKIDLRPLTRIARGHWAMLLPSWMLEVMQNPDLCCSVNDATWGRWIREERRTAGDNICIDTGLKDITLGNGDIVGSTCSDGHRLIIATRALISTLRRKKKEPALEREVFIERLRAWKHSHGQIGGWLNTMYEWLLRQALANDGGVFSSSSRLGPSGLLRYCSGFFHIFIEEVRLVPCKYPVDAADLERAVRRVAERILVMKSPGPGVVAFRSFLAFIAQAFRLELELEEDFELAGLPMAHRSRLISPSDYRAARTLIEQNHRSQPYAALRLKVALALGYRIGLRSGELASRKVKDFALITVGGRVIGDLRIRDNEAYELKSRSSTRTIPLHVLLTPIEMKELYQFLDQRKSMLGGAGWESDLLFADVATPRAKYVDIDVCVEVAEVLRRVTFDPNVVFHDLRHSAASMLMIRLFDEGLLRGAFDGIPGYAKMRKEFDKHQPLSFALCGPQADHPSRLYALARILGHLDPRTSLMYYVHTADMIIGATIQNLGQIPPDAQGLVDGVKSESVKRRERRRRAGAAPRMTKRSRARATKNAKPSKNRVYGRHDLGLVGSYSAEHARKILYGILSSELSASRKKALGITDEAIAKVFSMSRTNHLAYASDNDVTVAAALEINGALCGLELLIDNVVKRRKPTWIGQVEALGDSPLMIWFETQEEAETRLKILQRNGLHQSLEIREAINSRTKASNGFEFFRSGYKHGAIEVLLPMFALVALLAIDRLGTDQDSASPP